MSILNLSHHSVKSTTVLLYDLPRYACVGPVGDLAWFCVLCAVWDLSGIWPGSVCCVLCGTCRGSGLVLSCLDCKPCMYYYCLLLVAPKKQVWDDGVKKMKQAAKAS